MSVIEQNKDYGKGSQIHGVWVVMSAGGVWYTENKSLWGIRNCSLWDMNVGRVKSGKVEPWQ